MLQTIRDWVSGWLAVVFFILLIIPFAFWGINYYFGQGGEVVAAEVNGSTITLRDYQRGLQNLRQRLRELTRAAPAAEQETYLRRQTIDNIIVRELLRQADAELGLRISDAQVRAAIEQVEYFQGEGGFDQKAYESNIAIMGLSPGGFENQVREDMMAEQLQNALVESAFVTDSEVRRVSRIREQTRDIRYALISADAIKESIEVSDGDVRKYYDGEDREYMEPEGVRLSYIELSLDKLADEVPLNEDDTRRYFEDNRPNYSVAEQRNVRQLLVPLTENATEEQVKQAQSRAGELWQQLNGGATMEEIADRQKEQSGMPVEFSEFGLLTRGVLEPEVEEAAFSMNEGERSQPVKSKSGVHIVEVSAIKGGETAPFEGVREDVERDYRRSRAEERFFELADQLATLAFEHPDTLEIAAEELGLTIRNSELISRDYKGTDILGDAKVLAAAFGAEVLQNRNNSELIELDNNRAVVLRVSDHLAARKKPLDEVRDSVVTRIKYERAREQTQNRGQEIVEKLRSGIAAADVAVEYGLEWREAPSVKQDDPNLNRAILRAAFSTGHPQAGATIHDGVSLGTGDYAVVSVMGVRDPAPDALKDEDLKAVRAELLRNYLVGIWTGFLSQLRREAEVIVYEDRIQ